MSDIPFTVLVNVLLFFIFPLAGAYIMIRLKGSPLIGYIIGGIFLSLVLGGKLSQSFISNFSMLGLVLLIFTVGLETNFNSIKRFGKFVIWGGLLQVTLSGLAIMILSILFRFSFIESLFFGFSFALSSTAVVSKIIQDKGEENSLIGGLATGVLIFQDLAFIPLIIIFSSFSKSESAVSLVGDIAFNSIKAAIVLIAVYYVGQKVTPILFNKIARISRELLNLLIVVFIVGALAIFSYLGVSSVLAAFIAGVVVGQTLEHYHIFSQIRPLRDLLTVIFFVFLGLTVQPLFILTHLPGILFFTFLVILTKIIIVLVMYILFRFHSRTAFALSIFLFQVGEDAFILLYQGFLHNAIRSDSYYFALSVVLISLMITPIMVSNKDKMYYAVRKFIKKFLPFLEQFIIYRIDRDVPNIDVLPLKDHIVLCGYGRVGHYIGRALMLANIPFIAIDYNFHTVEKAKKDGVNIIYGDPTEIDVLDYAQCDQASALIAAVPERFTQETIILNAKKLNPKIIILTRVHREEEQRRMKDLGVEVVVQPEFEASLSIIRRLYSWKGVTKDEISNKIRRLKIEHGMV